MKKIGLLLTIMLFTASLAFGLTSTESNSASGQDDDPVVVSVTFSGLPTGSTITNTEITTTIGSYVGNWYDMDLDIGGNHYTNVGELTNASYSDLNGQDPNGQTITVTSVDLDSYSDYITLTLDVTITYAPPAGSPGEPTNPSPADDATNVAISGNLTWDFGADTDTYDLWFGEAGSMTEVVSGAVAGASGSYAYSGLSNITEYEWQVIAYNAAKLTTNGPIWSFTTELPAGMIQIGSGTAINESLPIEPFYGYDYTQSIYLSSDFSGIGADKRIEKLYYNYTKSSTGDNDEDDWVIYIGTTANTNLDGGYIDVSTLTEVFNGSVGFGALAAGVGWLEITLTIPFNYNPSTDGNLIIAVDENTPSYTSSSDDFYCDQDTRANVSRYYHNDSTNPDPTAPPAGTASAYYPNTRFQFENVPTNPQFSVNPTSKDFGTVNVGESSAAQTFTITNTGGGTLTIDPAISITGTDNTQFSLTDANTYPVNLGADENMTVDVTFEPTTEGAKTANLHIVDNIAKTEHDIALSGTGYDPTLAPPFTEDFSTWYPTDWSKAQGLLEAPVTFTSTTTCYWYEDGFANVGTTGAAKCNVYGTSRKEWMITPPINLGAKTNYQLEFDLALTDYSNTNPPESVGDDDKYAVIISTDNGATWTSANALQMWDNTTTPSFADISTTGEHITIDLTGYSGLVKLGFYAESTVTNADNDLFVDNVQVREIPTTPIFSIDPTSKDFGTVNVGESSAAQTFTITNTGGGTLTIDPAISITGTDPTQFSLTDANTYPVNLGANENMTVDVTFSPTSLGEKTANLHIVDNLAITKAEHDIPLSGDGWNINHGGGGTAQGGYYFANSTSGASGAPSQPSYSWVDISTTGTNVYADLSGNDGYAGGVDGYDIGFTFNFFGVDYTKFWVGADGWISFSDPSSWGWNYSNVELPDNTIGQVNIIALFWDDLKPTTPAGIPNLYYETVDGNLVVTYDHYEPWTSVSATKWFTAQIILYPSGNIELQYHSKGADMPIDGCTVGIQNAAGDAGVNYLYDGTGGPIFAGAKAGEIAVMFGENPNTLPVELIPGSLTAEYTINEYDQEYVTINWATASETDVLGFYVWRSETDDFSTAGPKPVNRELIPGQGTISETHYYSFEDISADVYTTYYYWLEVADMGGTSSYHGSVSFIPEEDNPNSPEVLFTKLGNSYPNPVTNIATIEYQIKGSIDEQDATIRIYNILGELVKTVQGDDREAEVNVSDMSTGIYFYQLKTDNFNEVKKMMVIR